MQAVVCPEFAASTIEDVPRPEPAPGEVVVAPDRVQFSVTECQLFHGREVAHSETIADRIAAGGARLFGHEFCGHVDAVGDGVTSLSVGDRVYAPGKIACGECAYCRAGEPFHCGNQTGIGYDRPGAVAEYVAVPAEPLCRLPEGVSDAEGAAMQPMASALLATVDAGIEPGDVVAVVGTGVMGYQVGQAAAALGASEVVAVDVRERPLSIAADRGMIPIDATETDPVAAVRDATDGVGADVAVAAAGGRQSHATEGSDPLATAHALAARGGTICQVGHIEGELTWRPRDTRSKKLTWVNPRTGSVPLGPNRTTGELAAEWVADGTVSIEEYVTHELTGLESFEEAIEITLEKDAYDALGPAQIVIER
ncbi:zinc-dependent alcohol dehydrogenase [Halopenitus persicus]|uniref:Threonine dehydrogenase n=1 Tax=Halopenitus persicus TaxID=1048396 RepID=A0A1H3FT71_9EURY|nr:alcohol dehydrogenase catalytic domain-containing protein [Halopenitus persicus]QHS16782.1 alcohol dehydrogenase catalytic domain-containing protein [haloarchaeon 3A1-DGR]SDX94273.1 Threonine dehydrogenase [Halopenitus persicus]